MQEDRINMREKSAKRGLAILLTAAVLLTGMTVPVCADDGNLPEAGRREDDKHGYA